MKQMIEFYTKKILKQNEGYRFIKLDYVYVPILQTYLTVTKRDYFALPLLDEIVLRLVNENVHQISELVDILGIERKLLEITIADLSVKDLLYCVADKCTLMSKGQSTLKDLKIVQRSKICLKDVYLDPINNKVLTSYKQLTYLDKVYNQDDKKMKVDFKSGDLTVFKKDMNNVNHVFLDETNIYNDRTKVQPSELISIDSIEKIYSKFVEVPIYIYVSDSGFDIDIASVGKNTKKLLQQYKTEIISQIRNHKLLKKVFTQYALKGNFNLIRTEVNQNLCDLALKYLKNKEDRQFLKNEIKKNMFVDRKLFDNEFEKIFDFLKKESESILIGVNDLDTWCYGDEFFSKTLSKIEDKKLKGINYSFVQNIDRCFKYIQRIKKIEKRNLTMKCDLAYISFEFDEEWELICVPEDVLVIDSHTHIYKKNFYLQHLIKK